MLTFFAFFVEPRRAVFYSVKQRSTLGRAWKGAKMRKEIVGVRFDPDVTAWLKRAAKNRRVTMSHIIREVVNEKFVARRK